MNAVLHPEPEARFPGPPARVLQFFILTVTGGAANLASKAVGPLQESIRTSFGFSDNQMALLQGPALALPVVFAAIPLGFLVDRLTRIRLLMAFTLLNLAGSALTAFAGGFELLFLARCIVGLSVAATTTTGFSLLADLYAPAQRGRAKAVLVIGQYAGSSTAFALGGALLGLFPGPSGWRMAEFWLTVPLLGVILLVLILAREPARTGVARPVQSVKHSLLELVQYRSRVLPLMLAVVLSEVPIASVMTWTAPTLARNFSLGAASVGALVGAAVLVSGLAGPITGGVLADLAQKAGGPRRTFRVLAMLSLVCVPGGFFAVAPNLYLAGAGLILSVTAMSATMAMGITLFTIVIPNELRGLCLALLSAAMSIFGLALPPLAVSGLSIALGGPMMIGAALTLVCVTSTILAAAIYFAASRTYPAEGDHHG